jgi:putative salt-induced outer membrane protein
MRRSLLATLSLAAIAAPAMVSAQAAENGFSGEGQLGLSLTTGNTEDTALLAALKLNYVADRFSHSFKALADYRDSFNTTTNEEYAVGYQLNYDMTPELYGFGAIDWEKNEFAGRTNRWTESAGLGFHAIATATTTLDLEGGIAFRQTDFIVGNGNGETAAKLRGYFSHAFNDNVSVSQEVIGIVGESNTVDAISAVTAKVTDALALRASYEVSYDSEPLLGLKDTDTATRISAVYGF